VENGKCVRAGAWTETDPPASWDMRADLKDWLKWVEKGIGMAGMGMAFTTGKLKFKVGDFKAMIKDPRMANPFVKSFGLMQQIGADELA
jgi:putative sterol carrier protein